jgi:hypothetical protein
MRALFSFDEPLSPRVLTSIFQIVSAFIGLLALLGAAAVLTTLNTAGFFTALMTALALIGAGLALVLLLRLVGEIWMTQLRIQDRLNVLGDELRR